MPNTAHIKYKDKGFWVPESFIEVLSQYICETFERIGINTFSPDLKEIYDDCHFNRTGCRCGMVNISLNNYINNSADKATLIQVLEQTKTLVLSKGTELNVSMLNQFESQKMDSSLMNKWTLPIKTQSLAATIEIIEQMLNGAWESSNYSVYYSGFPKPLNMLEI